MKAVHKHLLLKYLLCFVLGISGLKVQSQRIYDNDIRAFVVADSLHPPGAETTLFTGSSSIRMWDGIEDYFPGLPLSQRGFGGSTIDDLVYYAPQIILPYTWKQIVIYCGENDLANDPTLTTDSLFANFKTLFRIIRSHQENVPILFISLKPSNNRLVHLARFKEANEKIRQFLEQQPNSQFVDIWPLMLNEKGLPDSNLFLDDGLHMNAKGYVRWTQELKKYLIP